VNTRHRDFAQPVMIPCAPTDTWPPVYVGREVEYTPLGLGGARARERVLGIIDAVKRILPHAPHDSQVPSDIFTPLGRMYVELTVLLEVASPTCLSATALAWSHEAAMAVLGRACTAPHPYGPVVLAHTPSDYGDLLGISRVARSLGCHLNLLSHRPLTLVELHHLATLISGLNVVFGPGGLSSTPNGRLRISCDPRADHVQQLVSQTAHDDAPKPVFIMRSESWAEGPAWRLQVAALGAPRSPVSTWLQAGLLQLALHQILLGRHPPIQVENVIDAFRCGPTGFVSLGATWPRWGRRRQTKLGLAVRTIQWLQENSMEQAADAAAAERIESMCRLAIDIARANAKPGHKLPTAPSDIAIKTHVLNRAAQLNGFSGVSELGSEYAARALDDRSLRQAVEALIVVDALFHSTSDRHSTYEAAARAGLFVKPRFEAPLDVEDPQRLPAGIAMRDRHRAILLGAPADQDRIGSCEWSHLTLASGRTIPLPNPWSGVAGLEPVEAAGVQDLR